MQFKWKLTYVSPVELIGEKQIKKQSAKVDQDTTDWGESIIGTIWGSNIDNFTWKVWDTVEIDISFKTNQGNNWKYYQNININGMRVLNKSVQVEDEDSLPR